MEQKNKLTLGSLFDGSGGFPFGGLLAGIKPVWASEVEPYPIAVTRSRFPHMKHYGDVSQMHGGEVEPVDIITFGSPCQDMSVAGKRAGLDGSRSNLFYEAVRIVKEMRCATNGKYPRYIVWENVPGAFSSNGGADFKAVLEAICKIKDENLSVPECKKWESAGEILGDCFSVAWRVLDAQFWGVPQRRRRIYLVADFAGGSAGEILFESEGLRRDMQTGDEAWQGVTADALGGVDGSNGNGGQLAAANYSENMMPPICSDSHGTPHAVCYDARGNGDGETACFTMQRSDEYQDCDVASTQSARQYKSATDLVVEKKRRYIIRRLTPTECARLQGFPDDWGHLAPYNPADAEFWESVRKTHATINGKRYSPVKDIKKWYDKLHNDGAEYKMWGNGIALPCAAYVIRRISEIYKQEGLSFDT